MKKKKFNWWSVYILIILILYIFLSLTRDTSYMYDVNFEGGTQITNRND